MASLESILHDVQSLSPTERAELIARLLEQGDWENDLDETGVGARGLGSWTESNQDESWEAYYPYDLRNNGASAS